MGGESQRNIESHQASISLGVNDKDAPSHVYALHIHSKPGMRLLSIYSHRGLSAEQGMSNES